MIDYSKKHARLKPNDLDPDIQKFVSTMSEDWRQYPSLSDLPVSEAREVAEKVRSRWTKGGPEMLNSTEIRVVLADGSVRIRILNPNTDHSKPALVYLHGGGWTIFSIDTHDRLMREYAGRTGFAVIAVDYSLSPESRFPRALDEIEAVIRWLKTHGEAHGIDRDRIALGGDSAGAAMTISTCIRFRDAGAPNTIAAMLLNYGAYDPACSNESYRLYGQGGYMWDPGEMAAFWRNYLGDTPPTDPLACPIYAELHDLPPAFSAIPECDVMFEEAALMAERLRYAGVPSHVAVYAGATHSFLEAVSIARISDRAFADASRWLVDTLIR